MDIAAEYLQFAADRDHPKALNLLALDCSLNGNGKDALLYYDRAARLGVVKSQLALGDLYHTGYAKIIARNDEKAVYWYCRAYLQGSTDAEERLDRLISSPREFSGGTDRVLAVLQAIEAGEAEPPEVQFIERKRRSKKNIK